MLFVNVAETPRRKTFVGILFQTLSISAYKKQKLLSHSSPKWILSIAKLESRVEKQGLSSTFTLNFLKRAISGLVKM